jgi:hypothetical protein
MDMERPSWIAKEIPTLREDDYEVTSQPSEDYNCIAWAAGDSSAWWSYLPGYRWPGTRSEDIESLVEVFTSLGYEECPVGDPEDGYEKVVLYAERGRWTHASRLTPGGEWVSKLGVSVDIRHRSAASLTGPYYGQVHCYMRRALPE